ncbi:MAG: Alanine racemase, catabolic [Betaproteobacteria bacterium ADurb.Bin341]|nr:MAG: Alanine racemase, catabolic [Betaproteobacteria bacterium ADurb.Bin341]
MSPSRPLRARIDITALAHNYRLVQRHAPRAKAWAVVKANAYGHGLWRVVEALRGEADGFAILEPETGAALREAGVRQPILLLEGVFSAQDVGLLVEHRLTAVVHCCEQLELIEKTAPAGAPLALYIKLNTGMNRLGFSADDFPTPQEMATRLPQAEVTYMTHFANADDERGVDWQMERFQAALKDWKGPVCLANSAAVLRHPQTHGDWVRPGIMLYGSSPFANESAASLGLQPVMTLESRIISVQKVAPGERIGYGGTFTADRVMRVGTVACGYGDGYPRHAPTGGPIAVCGHRTRILGRVSMDLLACDLTEIPMAGIGAPVTLWGRGEGGDVPADEVAAAADTIAYELFCALAPRVPVDTLG